MKAKRGQEKLLKKQYWKVNKEDKENVICFFSGRMEVNIMIELKDLLE